MGMYETGVNKIFDAVTVLASGTSTSARMDLSQLRTDNATLQIELTGNGTASFAYTLSNDDTTYLPAYGIENTIVSGFTKTSGPSTNGKILINFHFELAEYMKITVTETGGANSITVSAWLVTR